MASFWNARRLSSRRTSSRSGLPRAPIWRGEDQACEVAYQGVDRDGVQRYVVTWETPGLQPCAIRVLVPDNPSTKYQHSFLIDLPVEPDGQPTYGNGLDELRRLRLQNKYNATIVQPIFPIDPWYADHPFDMTINFETFMSKYLTTWVDSNLATSGGEKKKLIGFSKSGYGAIGLLFKHPSVFDAAAAFDFPTDMASYDDFGFSSARNYGTEANFQNNYRLTHAFIDAWKAPFTTSERIWISEGSSYRPQVANFSALLASHGVFHTLSIQTHDAHTWFGGWLSDVVSGLFGLRHGSVEDQLDLTGRARSAEEFVCGAKILRSQSQIRPRVTSKRFGGAPYARIVGLKRRSAVSSLWSRVQRSAKVKRLIARVKFLGFNASSA
jgi:Putative esterase